jgi:hypothetical protein
VLVRAWAAPPRPEGIALRPLVAMLATVQVVAFAGQEVLERLVSGAPLGDLVQEQVLAIGVVVQIGIGVLGAFALRWLTRAADRVASVSIPSRIALPRRALAHAGTAPLGAPRRRLAVSVFGVRAPPAADAFPAS